MRDGTTGQALDLRPAAIFDPHGVYDLAQLKAMLPGVTKRAIRCAVKARELAVSKISNRYFFRGPAVLAWLQHRELGRKSKAARQSDVA